MLKISLTVFCVSGCCGITKNPDEAYDSLFDVSGYPAIGDIPTLNRKIFKGVRVAIREHPYVASIRRQFAHYVTGSLITPTLVLTVAHPLHLVPIQELGVVVGQNYADRGTMVHTVIMVIIHEDFDPYTLFNDVAMVKVYEDAHIRTAIKTINLSPIGPLHGTFGFVTGWGRCDMTARELCLPRTSIYYPDEIFDPMLRTIVFQIKIPNYYCEGYKRQDVVIGPGMLCVGVAREENPVTPCLAVPGAPLVVKGRLAGLQSWGFGCGYIHDLPLVYTSIHYYEKWISHNVRVLNTLLKSNYTQLFEATRAYISCRLLEDTRLLKPNRVDDLPEKLEQTSLDKILINLEGNYYDIRDFVDNGRYHERKKIMLDDMWYMNEKIARINETKPKTENGRPFFSTDANDSNESDNK